MLAPVEPDPPRALTELEMLKLQVAELTEKVAQLTPVAAPAQPVKAGAREESRVKMTRMRMRIAQRCVNGVNILAQAMQGSQALKFLPLAK